MTFRSVFRAAVVLIALGLGLIWATAATAIGFMGGLLLGLGIGGFLVRGLSLAARRVLRPGRSARHPLLPGWVATSWLAALAVVCGVVAYRVHDGAFGDPHGADFVPLAVPFLLLTLTAGRLADEDMRASKLDAGDAAVGAGGILLDP